MNSQSAAESSAPSGGIGFFEKWLSVWVALSIAAGIGLGSVVPNVFQFLAGLEYASVNLVVAILIWGMVYPMMVNVDFASLRHIGDRPKGLVGIVRVTRFVGNCSKSIHLVMCKPAATRQERRHGSAYSFRGNRGGAPD